MPITRAERTRTWIEGLGGRKFILSMGAGIVSSLLLLAGVLTSSDYVLVVLGTVGAFIAGNAWQARGATRPGAREEE